MPRGLFPQCVCLLASKAPTIDDVAHQLEGFDVLKTREAKEPSWLGGHPEAIVRYEPELNGHVLVDVIDAPWPDTMGDPEKETDLFGAWSLGAFGPGAFPGNLERAAQQHPPELSDVAESHAALIRLRTTYTLEAGENAAVRPEGADALDELEFLTAMARALLTLDEALMLFNPGGEVLLQAKELDARRANAQAMGVPPLDVFSSVRLVEIGELPGWSMMDTVGLEQLFLPDHEAFFESNTLDPNQVGGWLRDVSLYVLEAGQVIESTDTIDGPGGTWRCLATHGEPALAPPRPVLRWFLSGASIPELLRAPPRD